ncbi:MAG: serine hydrolase domain-containing protein [Bacteroidota bacterium]
MTARRLVSLATRPVSAPRRGGSAWRARLTSRLPLLLQAFATLAVGGGCGEAPLPAHSDEPLAEAVEAWRTGLGVPGVAVGVYRGSETLLETGAGRADRATGREVRADTPFCVGSVSKLFVAAAALRLASRGDLDLDAPLARYGVDVPGSEDATLRMLGDHRAGFRNAITLQAVKDTFTAAPAQRWTRSDLLALTDGAEPHFAPGEGWTYSNTNTLLLADAMERATGLPWDSLLAREVTRPADLTATARAHDGCGADPAAARGYQLGDDRAPTPWRSRGDSLHDVTADHPSKWGASGDLRSTVLDLRQFADAAFRGNLLTPEARAERDRAVETGEVGYRYGFGLEVRGEGDAQILGHCGAIPGYNACLGYRPSDDATVIVLTNVYGTERSAMPALAISRAAFQWLAARPRTPSPSHASPS